MAKNNYLVEGISGSGKSSVSEGLRKRGYNAVDSDKEYAFFADPKTGKPTHKHHYLHWVWDTNKMNRLLDDQSTKSLFVCGGSNNREEFIHKFKLIFNLAVDEKTLRYRLKNRTNNSFGKKEHELNKVLEIHRLNDKPYEVIDIDATQTLDKVIDDILKVVDES